MRIEPRVVRTDDYVPSAPFLPRVAGGQSFFGMTDDHMFWSAAAQLYDQDNVEGAYKIASDLGIGSYAEKLGLVRLLDAEHDVRMRGQIEEVNGCLSVEYVAAEQLERLESLTNVALKRAQEEKDRFCWTGADKVLLTLLTQEKDAPWASYRYGYCAQKVNYYKICIPYHATSDPARFDDVFGHEFAHVISLSESKHRLSKWLGEGFSVYVTAEYSAEARQALLSQPRAWLDPENLELQFGPGLDLGSQGKWLAYQQAGYITRYLAALEGERKLMALLEDIGSESILRNLKTMALGATATAEAIRHIYHASEDDVFQEARKSLERVP